MADDTSAEQPFLISGFYRCDDCGALGERLRKTRRFRLCDGCYERIVPAVDTIDARQIGSPAHQAITRYWEWFAEMDKRVPRRSEPGYKAQVRQPLGRPRAADDFYPLCECGRPRASYAPMLRDEVPSGLFGGPFARECPACEARRQVEQYVKSSAWLHPEWDDEEWLDLLWRVYPKAFEAGVLPDYWFELRWPGITRTAAPEPRDPLARRPRRNPKEIP